MAHNTSHQQLVELYRKLRPLQIIPHKATSQHRIAPLHSTAGVASCR